VSDPAEEPPQNDPAIADTDDLLRRVPNRPRMIATESDGRLRPSSAALELRDGEIGCSVHVQGRLPNPPDPLIVLEGHSQDWGVATATAGDAGIALWVRRGQIPLPELTTAHTPK
jgi:hypothetical protein